MPVRVGPYTLSTTLGKGNYGVVKLGRHERTGEEYAVKVVEKRVLEDDLPVNMDIRREMSILRALCHPNIVALTEVMVSKSKVYLVMELARGGDFFQLVSATGRLGEGLSRRYFRQLVAAVHHCHTRGVFHRDIKVRGGALSGWGGGGVWAGGLGGGCEWMLCARGGHQCGVTAAGGDCGRVPLALRVRDSPPYCHGTSGRTT